MLKPYVLNQAFFPTGFDPATQAGFKNISRYGGMYINLASPYSTSNTGSASNFYRGNPVINGGGSVSYLRGSHTMKAGVDYIYQNRLQRNLYQQFTFSDSITSNINIEGPTWPCRAPRLELLPPAWPQARAPRLESFNSAQKLSFDRTSLNLLQDWQFSSFGARRWYRDRFARNQQGH